MTVARSTTRALAPRMIGREAPLRDLSAHLRAARDGAGRIVFVAGDAGIGKTRLAREFVGAVTAPAGAAPALDALVGHCYGEGEDPAAPFGPFVDALRYALRAHGRDQILRRRGPWATDLATLLPELAPGVPAANGGDPRVEKRRLFEALYHALRPADGEDCRLILLEDLHWSDQTSQELLRYLARAIERDRVLILATYRTDELHRRHPLGRLLAHLTRERLHHEVRLAALTRDELGRLLETILDRLLPPGFADAFYDRTGGNPFFAEEIVGALLDQGRLDALIADVRAGKRLGRLAIPLSISESILTRAAELDTDAAETLKHAAVIGRRFDFDLLLRLTGLDEPTLLRALEALIARQLIVEEGGEGRTTASASGTR